MGSKTTTTSTQTQNNPGAFAAQQQYNKLYGPWASGSNPMMDTLAKQQTDFYNRFTQAADRSNVDYGNMMQGYNDFGGNVAGLQSSIDSTAPTNFSFERVNADRPAELTKAYGYLDEAAPGYRDFANTGGYSEQDIADLRARGTSPVRAAYQNAQANIERAKAIGGGYSPNYIAATAKMTRDQSQQSADAMQNVNAKLAEDIRTGKLAGLSGLTGIGSTMGGLSSEEASRMLQAAMSNQTAGLETQRLAEASRQAKVQNQLGIRQLGLSGLNAKTGLYGTTPGAASMFGNQALTAMGQNLTGYGMNLDNATRLLGLMGSNQTSTGTQTQTNQGPHWWDYALAAAPYIAAPFTGGASLMAAPYTMSRLRNNNSSLQGG